MWLLRSFTWVSFEDIAAGKELGFGGVSVMCFFKNILKNKVEVVEVAGYDEDLEREKPTSFCLE